MGGIVEALPAVGKVFGLIILGLFVFQIGPLRRILDRLIWINLNILFPIYFIDSFSRGWDEAVAGGWSWMVIFFVSCFVLIGFQYLLGRALIGRRKLIPSERPNDLIILFAVQNSGYIPLPIIEAIAPDALIVYLFFFFFAFNIIFWGVTVSLLSSTEKGFRFRINMPLIGLAAGVLIAAFGLYDYVPVMVRKGFSVTGGIAINLILVLMGGILATIPKAGIFFSREFVKFIIVKMIAYPAIVLTALLFLPLDSLRPAMAAGIKIVFVLQAAVPPATNNLIVARAYGTREQELHIGNGMFHTYAASLVTLPVFLVIAILVF